MNQHGFLRLTAASGKVSIANPMKNAEEILRILELHSDSDVVVTGELGITGYTCKDLFSQNTLMNKAEEAIEFIVTKSVKSPSVLLFVGAPIRVRNSRYNCAVAIQAGAIKGIVPKQNIPNSHEFEEHRWFRPANGEEPEEIWYAKHKVPFGIDLFFKDRNSEATIFVEICHDVWVPIPPSSHAALAGANVLLNLSASNEIVGKSEYRRHLISQQSGRCIAAYAYASCGPSESTTDVVFGGHLLISENGEILEEDLNVGTHKSDIDTSHSITADVDISKLQGDRRSMNSFGEQTNLKKYREISVGFTPHYGGLKRNVNGLVYIEENFNMGGRARQILNIQKCGLAKCLSTISPEGMPVYIPISGGSDSTVAGIVTAEVYDMLGWPRELITGITMPSYGTTSGTKNNAVKFIELMGFKLDTVDIREACLEAYRNQKHKPFGIDIDDMSVDDFEKMLKELPSDAQDLVFENTQARYRTMHAMNRGFMIGTGDLSELLIGWCTYGADQQSMYNPNSGVPKTLMRFIIDAYSNMTTNKELFEVLQDILDTIVSPELLPSKDDKISQSSEDKLGPYEYHDFVGFHTIRHGFTPEKILYLAEHANWKTTASYWNDFEFDRDLFLKAMKTFYKMHFTSQYKRVNVPAGAKVGSISASPRGDLRMASDVDPTIWIEAAQKLS